MALDRRTWSVPELLPHSGSMILLDDLIDDGPDWVMAGVRISEDSMFFEPGAGMPCWLGIEYMAQAVALYSGLMAKRRGDPVRIGFLLGSRRYRANVHHFPLGGYLHVYAKEEWQDGQMGVFDCTIDEDDCRLATARLNVFLPSGSAFPLEGAGR